MVPPRGEDKSRPCVRDRASRTLRRQRNAGLSGAKGWAQSTEPKALYPRKWSRTEVRVRNVRDEG